MTFRFSGNQVRLLGVVGPDGGWADAFLDGVKQPTLIECWNPAVRYEQPIFIKSGLTNGPHELKIVVRGEKESAGPRRANWNRSPPNFPPRRATPVSVPAAARQARSG